MSTRQTVRKKTATVEAVQRTLKYASESDGTPTYYVKSLDDPLIPGKQKWLSVYSRSGIITMTAIESLIEAGFNITCVSVDSTNGRVQVNIRVDWIE